MLDVACEKLANRDIVRNVSSSSSNGILGSGTCLPSRILELPT